MRSSSVCLKPAADRTPLARGTSASTGVAIGAAVFDPERATTVKQGGRAIVLIRENAETSDIGALSEAAALIAAEGARTSHAAVVARELGKVCIVGCEGLTIDPSGRKGAFGAETIEEGETLSVDGVNGKIYRGEIEVVSGRPTELLATIARWRAA
jgi:pyruvate,orthophosphate dikinase